MRLSRVLTSGWIVVGAVMIADAASASVTFTDSTFANYVVGFQATPPGTSFSASQCASCGVGGSAGLQLVITDNGTGSQIAAAVINPLFSYDPSAQGAIASISASVQKNFIVRSNTNTYGNSFRPVIEQGGSYYTALLIQGGVSADPSGGTNSSGYQTFSIPDLSAAQFGEFDTMTGSTDMSSHPDFAGGLITFGIGQYLAPAPRGMTTLTSEFDDLVISVQTAAPEPATWATMIVGFSMVGGTMRRRRRAGLRCS